MKPVLSRAARLAALVTAATMLLAGAARAADSQWVYKVVAANDLGMHCVDADFSVFSILPPYNVVNAQVLRRSGTDKPSVVGSSLVTLRYEAVRDASGSINSTSRGGKTNFWQYAPRVYGAALADGQGLKGLYMPADAPTAAQRTFAWDSGSGLFKAEGVPILPLDDARNVNRYPLMRIVAIEKATGRRVAWSATDGREGGHHAPHGFRRVAVRGPRPDGLVDRARAVGRAGRFPGRRFRRSIRGRAARQRLDAHCRGSPGCGWKCRGVGAGRR